MTYPTVASERDTLELVLSGWSLARYGDGELNLCRNLPIKIEKGTAELYARLRGILHDSGACLVGIPNLHSPTPKRSFWAPFHGSASLLSERPYVSAFVTRPDSAPWIDTPDYWQRLGALWVGQDVTLVRGSERSLTGPELVGAKSVREVLAPREHAWAVYDQILDRVGTPERVLLCLGPTATVMAVDLCAKGVHAVDIGHAGTFLRKHRKGHPMVMTAEDRAA